MTPEHATCRGRMLAVAAAALAMTASMEGRAAESVVPVTPPGSTDVDQAVLPPATGLYIGAFALPYNRNNGAYDSTGHKVPGPFNVHLHLQIYGLAALYVYPVQPLGGTLASTFVQPTERLAYEFGSSGTRTQFGLADAYTDVFYWTKNLGLAGATPGQIPMPYGLNVGAGFAMIVPDGGYNKTAIIRLGSNFWVFDPNVALTYNTGPKLSFGDNTQLSTRVFYGIPTRNDYTHYRSGQILNVDWSATQQFGNLRLGVAGYYQTQITADDPGTHVSLPNGNRYTEAAIGPVAEYFIPKWGAFVKAKYAYTFVHRNYVDEQFFVLSVGFKL